MNKLETLTDPLNRSAVNTYDRSGRLTRVQMPNGMEVNFTYDNGHRMTRKTLDGGRYYNYSYDGANNLTGVSDQASGAWSWSYDRANRVTNSKDPSNYQLKYVWDKSHNLNRIVNTANGTVWYGHGSDNKLLAITLPDYNQISYHYDENDRIFQVRYPGTNNYRNILYHPNGWVNKILDRAIPGDGTTYSYYDNGNISSISSFFGNDNFSYDANGRLTSWGTESYQYDAAGNLLTKGGSSFTYNSANQITNSGYNYDNNGNLTSDGTYNYTYDAENQLTEVKRVSDNSLVASYTYYYNGLRRSKTLASGSTIYFQYDAFGNLIRESYNNGITKGLYYYDSNGRLLVFKAPHDNIYYYVHTNLRGDVVAVDDYNSQPGACLYNYDPWGKPLYVSEIVISQPFRYAGYYYDQETGLYYCKSRYYSPTLGRFLTKDSIAYIHIENPKTLNPYVYANNNPVSKVDPSGNDVGWATIEGNNDPYCGYDDGEQESSDVAQESIVSDIVATTATSLAEAGYDAATIITTGPVGAAAVIEKNVAKAATKEVAKRLTSKEATKQAAKLGFIKTNFFSSGQPVFKNGNRYITPDIDRHNGGVWKMADSVENLAKRQTRMGTYDANLNRIGD